MPRKRLKESREDFEIGGCEKKKKSRGDTQAHCVFVKATSIRYF